MLYFKKTVDKMVYDAVITALKEYESYHQNRKDKYELMELEQHVGSLIIHVSNEVENLKVLKATRIEFITQSKNPVLVGKDEVTGNEYYCLGHVMKFTKQKFEALIKVDPNARIAIFYPNNFDTEVDKSATQEEEILHWEAWKYIVYNAYKI